MSAFGGKADIARTDPYNSKSLAIRKSTMVGYNDDTFLQKVALNMKMDEAIVLNLDSVADGLVNAVQRSSGIRVHCARGLQRRS